MYKFGNKIYPDTSAAIIRDKKFLSVLFQHVKAEFNSENLLFVMTRFNPELMYGAFFTSSAKYQVNMTSVSFARAGELAGEGDWRHDDWIGIIEETKRQCHHDLDKDVLPRFFKSDFFWEYHIKNGGTRNDQPEDVADPPPLPKWDRAAEYFGIKNVAALRFYIAKFERSGEVATIGDLTKLLRAEGNKLNPSVFNKLLISEGFAQKPANIKPTPLSQEPEDEMDSLADFDEIKGQEKLGNLYDITITLHRKRLEGCGFKLVKKPKDLERIENMLRAYIAKDRNEAIKIYERILKAEKDNKELQITPFVELIKKMREKKVFDWQSAA